jgi:uncharacterized protein (TIGR00730 family)
VPRRLAVYCGSNLGARPAFKEQATRLGSAMGRRGVGLVYGGGHVGLMGTVADALLAAGGEVHGVITKHLVRAEIAHEDLTELHVVDSMHERKARMAQLADGFVALPGGYGTLDETLEVLTWNQLGLLAKPVVFFDIDGFFDPLFAFLDQATDAALLRPAHRMLAQRARSVDEVIALGLAPAPLTGHKWIDRDATPSSTPAASTVEEVG